MFKFEEICELIRLVESTGVTVVEVEHAGARLRIDGKQSYVVTGPPPGGVSLPVSAETAVVDLTQTAPAAAEGAEKADDKGEEEGVQYVLSPIVGTFYRAPNPDADPYAKVGDVVDTGKTLCIVEAMKLMNEIESDVSGTIVKVFPDNAQPVEYGERLFAVRLS